MISSILLAAGMSKRMGEPKALLDWGGEPLIRYQIRQLQDAGVDEVVVVLGYRADDIHRKLHGLTYRSVLNPIYQLGRAGSLRAGAKAISQEASAIVLLNVDQPRPAELIRSVIEAHTSEASATRPVHGDDHGHPVVLAGRLRGALITATEDQQGLKGVLANFTDTIVDVPSDERCLVDMNTPDDYAASAPTLSGDP